MARPASKMRATYQDVVDAPEHLVAEILGGELVLTPRPSPRHALAEGRLFRYLDAYFMGGGGAGRWVLLPEPELHFLTEGLEVLVPDVAGWKRERLPSLPERAAVKVAPDWVCEILSPSTEKRDRSTKMPIYAREGVGHLWFLQPDGQILEAHRLAQGRWEELGTWKVGAAGAADVRAEPFAAVTLDLGDLSKCSGPESFSLRRRFAVNTPPSQEKRAPCPAPARSHGSKKSSVVRTSWSTSSSASSMPVIAEGRPAQAPARRGEQQAPAPARRRHQGEGAGRARPARGRGRRGRRARQGQGLRLQARELLERAARRHARGRGTPRQAQVGRRAGFRRQAGGQGQGAARAEGAQGRQRARRQGARRSGPSPRPASNRRGSPMVIGEVVGRLWASRQAGTLAGQKLLLVRPLGATGQ